MASSYHHYLNCSKSQMCLFKILHIISSIPPTRKEEEPSFHSNNNNNNNKGVGIDLNISFCSITEEESEEESQSSASSIDQVNNNNEKEEEEEGVVVTQVQSFEVENNVESETASFRGDSGNCLDLLIEAARVLSEKDESDSEELSGELVTRRVKKRKERWVVVDLYGGGDVVEEDEREPVVRSKRGRNQTLPFRLRDSVVEPLKRRSNRHRRSSFAKRLLR